MRFVHILRNEQDSSRLTAKAVAAAKKDPSLVNHMLVAARRAATIRARKRYYSIFGPQNFKHVERLVEAHDELLSLVDSGSK